MKKIILTIAIVAVAATSAMAQSLEGLSAGAGYLSTTSTGSVTVGNTTTTTKTPFTGFYAGAAYAFEVYNGLAVEPGIQFKHIGNTETSSLLGQSATTKTTENYIEIPVNFTYGLEIIPSTLKVSVYAGPTFDFGLSSKAVTTNTVTDDVVTVNNYDEDSKYGKFDVLVGAGVHVDVLEMIRVSAGYNFGLINRTSQDNSTIFNKGLHVGVAYLF